jgi:hypothetical protein
MKLTTVVELLKDQSPNTEDGIARQREEYLQWMQVSARDVCINFFWNGKVLTNRLKV